MKTFKEWVELREEDEDLDLWAFYLTWYAIDPNNPFNPIVGLIKLAGWTTVGIINAFGWVADKIKSLFSSSGGDSKQKAQAAYKALPETEKQKLRRIAAGLKQKTAQMQQKQHS